MKRNKFLEMMGFRFVLNHKSRIIHRVADAQKRCQIEEITKGGYNTYLSVLYFIKRLCYTPCNFCSNDKQTDSR